ncbi:Glucans biosynthesis protein G precursor [Hydrogenophaga sp. T4]|nr:Glucans biosynthesis protein G precursor [Hydrogenophaga sp. T4]
MPTPFQPFPAPRIQRSRSLLIALLAMLAAASTQAQGFDWNTLSQLARTRAQAPYSANSDKLPADLAALDYDQVRDIRFRPEQSLWRAEKRSFETQFFHLGLYQTQPVRIHEITPEACGTCPTVAPISISAATPWTPRPGATWAMPVSACTIR